MTTEVKRKRGRPRKNPVPEIPEEIQNIIQEVEQKQEELQQQIEEELPKEEHRDGEWDVKIDDPIEYFDKRLSYELTGYKPLTETEGLDFRPEWFTQARDTYLKTEHYCSYYFGSKAYRDFWNEEYRRCKNGYTVNGYTITGFNYYFLNYYQLPNTRQEEAGGSSDDIFPRFFVYQYEFFHYFELCRKLRKNFCLMKSRGIGFSEINAAICDCFFNCFRKSRVLVTASSSDFLNPTLQKIWNGLTLTNDKTDGGMFKLRQVLDKNDEKKASYYKVVNGQKIEEGFMSEVKGIIAENDRKIRGRRVQFLLFEEAGSNPVLLRSFIKGEELVQVGGDKIGVLGAGGTGGDHGAPLAGLTELYYHPESYKILPFKHNYTDTGDFVLTGYFIPAYVAINRADCLDNRGVPNIEKAKAFYQHERDLKTDPQALISYKAEQCWTAEEAFAAEGDNKFNKVKLSDQIVRIRIMKEKPTIQRGYMQFVYKGAKRERSDITGVKFVPHANGPVRILEAPLWEITEDKQPGESIEEYEDRKKLESETISTKVNNLYVAGIDGIDIGASETSDQTRDPSKFCTMIKRRVYGLKEPTYVAYYLDRPNDVREAYIQSIALLMWYNCQANLEATRTSVLTYARDNKFMQYFMRRPRVCSGDITKRRTVNQYGTTATVAMIDHQTDLIRDYVEDYSRNIWFLDLLDQLIKYTDENKGKFDMVAAMAMAEIGDEELSDIVPKKAEPVSSTFQDIGYYKDENGYTRYGVIPNQIQMSVKASWDLYDGRNITSDPRYR